jgi:hypothetical protein
MVKGVLGVECLSLSLCGSSVRGTWREGSLAGDPKGYVEKALETGISLHRGPVWGTSRRARLPGTLRVYEGARGMGCLSLKRLRRGGLGELLPGDPGR